MTNKIETRQFAPAEFFILTLLALAFAAVNVTWSTHFGRLAVPPTYDDIGYISNGLVLLDAGYQHGWKQWLLSLFTREWHAPVAALQACLAFAVFGKELWAPYLLNGLYLIALLAWLRREFPPVTIRVFLGIVISLLAWPLTSYLIVEFRPDIPTNLFLALGTWGLAKRHEEIGQGQYVSPGSSWKISWPFLAALWLKPAFSPVAIGLWIAAWFILCAFNHFVAKRAGGLRNTLASFGSASFLLFILFLPYLLASWRHLTDYFVANIFSSGQDMWSLPLSLADNLKYYLIGGGGRATMGWWPLVTFVAALSAFLLALHARDQKALRLGGIYLAFSFVAWAGMTLLKNKSPWFGSLVSSHVLGVFILSSGYIIARLSTAPIARNAYVALLVLLGVGLHAWPNSSGVLPGMSPSEIPAYSREAKRVFKDTCDAVQKQADGRKVTIIIPAISLIANPDLIELCAMVGDAVPLDAPRIHAQSYSQILTTIKSYAESAEPDVLALVLSPDFPGIPGGMPTSKRLASISKAFLASNAFKPVGMVKGPIGMGHIQILRKSPAFSPIENERGMKAFEGPYPDKKLPVVRWALFPAAEFDVRVTPGRHAILNLTGLPSLPRIVANIRLSGGEEKTCEFAMSVFTPCNVDFVPKTDMVRVKIEPQSGGQGESTPKSGESLLFSRISVAQIGGGEANGAQPGDSPFSGVDFLEGFGDVEGPYKEWELPVVIWGRGGFSRIGVVGTRGGSGMLLLEWRPGEAVQAIDIFHQDALLGHCTVNAPPGAFSRCELRLNSRDAASGELTLRYVGNIETLSNKMNNSALFKQVRFIEKDG